MKWLKNRKNRLLVSLLAAMAASSLVVGGIRESAKTGVMAWWGTLYPEFCFAEPGEDMPRKIGFRLAELLEW